MTRRGLAGVFVLIALTSCDISVNEATTVPGDYSRDAFGGWLDVDGDGCDTREEILERDAGEAAADSDSDGCRDDASIVDVSTGRSVTARRADIDHIVSLRDAWDSGASEWPSAQRAEFANDPGNLWAVAASVNRAKGDDEPQQWRPENPGAWCRYATAYAGMKQMRRLTISAVQRSALADMCPAGWDAS